MIIMFHDIVRMMRQDDTDCIVDTALRHCSNELRYVDPNIGFLLSLNDNLKL